MPAATRRHGTVDADPGFDRFGEAWDQFFSAIRRARGRAARKRAGGLSLSQYHLLAALADCPRLPVGELALAAGVSPPTATRTLDALERAGVVERDSSAEDRRVVTISLTRRGRALLNAKREQVARRRRAVYDSLEPSERAQAERLLRRLADSMEEL